METQPITRAERRRAERESLKKANGVLEARYIPADAKYRYKRERREKEQILKEEMRKKGKTDEEIDSAIREMRSGAGFKLKLDKDNKIKL